MWSSKSFSQSKIPVESITTDWSLFQEVKGVKFFAKKEIFSSPGRLDLDYIVIKLENTTNEELNISYNLAVYYNLGCNGCNSDEYNKTLAIPPHSSIEGKMVDGNSPVAMPLTDPNLKNGWIAEFISTEKLTIK
jgi:hypothetical protein